MKILHYMPVPSKRYNKTFINMIRDNEKFSIDDHIFWIMTEESYLASANINGVYFKKKHWIKELKKIKDEIDLVIVHGFDFKLVELLNMPERIRKKMIWVVWGHDLYRIRDLEKRTFKDFTKTIIKLLLYKYIQIPFVRTIKCVGIGFSYDAIEIQKWYGDITVKKAPYDLGYDFLNIQQIKANLTSDNHCKETYNILLGHSGYEYLQHIKYIQKLENYHSKSMKIFIPLSYGNSFYRNEVIKYSSNCNMRIEILTDLLNEEEYLKFLAKIDIAIFDFKHQAALGNIYLLLYFEKKIYLNIDGILYKGFKNQNINVFDVEDIGKVSEAEFMNSDFSTETGVEVSELAFDSNRISDDWKKMFEYCSKESE